MGSLALLETWVAMTKPMLNEQTGRADHALLAVALVLPTLVTWLYFVALAAYPSVVQQGAYAVGKGVQFALPVVWIWLVLRQRPALARRQPAPSRAPAAPRA